MHDGTVRAADDWIRSSLEDYVQWAPSHNSLLVITWDEGPENASDNHVATIFYGAHVKAGQYSQTLNHYNLLRSIEDMYAITPLGKSAGKKVSNLSDVFL
jgi:acid phosphatase